LRTVRNPPLDKVLKGFREFFGALCSIEGADPTPCVLCEEALTA
jgi:hypothetical protein